MGVRLGRILVLTCVLLGLLPAPVIAAPPNRQPQYPVDKVLLFSLPRVTWADFAEADLPHLRELLSHSMVAQLSVRTADSRTTSADGYATIGAGNRADGAEDGEVFFGYPADRDEQYEGRPAYQAYQARTGHPADGEVLHLGVAGMLAANAANRYASEPGALGSALGDAGYSTAVLGNADLPGLHDRSAALAVMDRNGVVDGGQVSPGLNHSDPRAPYGSSMDPAAVLDAFDTAWRENDLTLVEASDLERVDAFSELALPQAWQELRRQALVEADALLGRLLERVDLRRDLVLVATPAAPRAGEELGVFAMAGPGVQPGVAVSGSTRRDGYLTLPDIAPTILERMGVPVPAVMTGTPIKLGQARPVDQSMISEYVRANEVTVFRDRVTGAVTVVFIVLQLLAYLFAALMVIRRGRSWPAPRWRPVTRFGLLTVLAIPTTTFLSGLVPYDRLGAVGYLLALIAGAAGIAAGATAAGLAARRALPTAAPMLPPLLIVAVTWITMIVDVLIYDGRLQLDTAFGYSPIVAGRFSGYGNFAFSLVAICAVILVTGGWAIAMLSRHRATATATAAPAATPASRPADRTWRVVALLVAAAVLGFTVVVDGYPAYGSDVGGVLAAVPSFALVLLLLAGVAITWRRLLLVGLATVATIGAFAAVDLSRPVEQRTHLGRLVERMGETGGLTTILQRKLLANLNILTSSIWTWVVPIGAAFLIVLALRRFDALGSLCRRIPGMAACLYGSAVVAGLGFALNDSGIAVPAMMSTILLPYLGYLVLRDQDRALPDAPDTAPQPAGTEPEETPEPATTPQG